MAVLSVNPQKFKIWISTEEFDRETESNGLACRLQFTYTEKYPDTEPVVEIEDEVDFEDNFSTELLENISATVSTDKIHNNHRFAINLAIIPMISKLFKQIQESLGLEMVFSIVSTAQEWLNVKWDNHKTEQENREAEKLREIEEAERVRFQLIYLNQN